MEILIFGVGPFLKGFLWNLTLLHKIDQTINFKSFLFYAKFEYEATLGAYEPQKYENFGFQILCIK
jgi:hypothetical protein